MTSNSIQVILTPHNSNYNSIITNYNTRDIIHTIYNRNLMRKDIRRMVILESIASSNSGGACRNRGHQEEWEWEVLALEVVDLEESPTCAQCRHRMRNESTARYGVAALRMVSASIT